MSEGKEKEFILCAAIHVNIDGRHHKNQPKNIDNGFVVCGRRHDNCYQTIASLKGISINEAVKFCIEDSSEEEKRYHQGFITSTNRYVDRKEGLVIARKNNQVKFGDIYIDDNDSVLISENLY